MRRTQEHTSSRLVFASDFVRDLTGRQVALNAITNAVGFYAPSNVPAAVSGIGFEALAHMQLLFLWEGRQYD